jgi:hypothetical protein
MQYKEINMEKVWNGTAWVDRNMAPYRFTTQNGESVGLGKIEYDAANNGLTEGLSTNPELSFGDKFKSWFTPTGEGGTSVGGNVLGGLGTIAGIGGTLADMYYANKSAKAEEKAADYARDRIALADKNNATFAKNAGNSASYQGRVG